jgi:pimeloyl-ACP methyl ester carboxylesterase
MDCRHSTRAVSGLNFHIVEWGPRDAAPILMLHGIRGYSDTFAGIAAALQPHFRVIAYDQRGRGETDWDPEDNYYTDAYVRDLDGVAEALGLERFDLLGHSMGGIVSIVYASTHPDRVRRLIVEDAGPGAFENSDGALRIRKELATTPASFDNWEVATAYMRALRPTVSEEARQQRLHNMLKPTSDGGFTWRYDHRGIASTRLNPDPQRVVDLVSHLPDIACPTLVLRGGRSDYLQPSMTDRMAALNHRMTVVEIPDAGHYVHDDQPVMFASSVRSFLGLPAAHLT